MRNKLLRSTPFRLTVILGTTFVLALLASGLIAFTLIQRELSQRMDRSITDSFDVISQSFGDSDLTDLADAVRSHASATLNHDLIYGLTTADGTVVAGNIGQPPASNGWVTLSAAGLGIPPEDGNGQYRAFIGAVGGTRLLVGSSFAETTEIARLTLTSIGWASVAILALVLASGAGVALRAQRRIDGIAETMSRVGHGELTARIAVGARSDDIDMLARQVNVALDRLSGLVEGMRQVSVNIAHDLKTPLNRLAITLEAAHSAESRKAPVAPMLAEAELEVQQLNATFDALLRIAQIEAGARRARFVPIQMSEILDKIADVYVDVAEEREQTLVVSHLPDLTLVDGDRDLLVQLCANLVENSIRYSPAETQIRITARQSADRVVLTFDDDGPGIPAEERDKVFERLYRIEKSRSTAGSGLGLSLVRAIAELHGAQIALDDNEPGLKVTISFPTLKRP